MRLRFSLILLLGACGAPATRHMAPAPATAPGECLRLLQGEWRGGPLRRDLALPTTLHLTHEPDHESPSVLVPTRRARGYSAEGTRLADAEWYSRGNTIRVVWSTNGWNGLEMTLVREDSTWAGWAGEFSDVIVGEPAQRRVAATPTVCPAERPAAQR